MTNRMSAGLQSIISSNPTVAVEAFILIQAKDFTTGADVYVGLTTSADNVTASPDGTARTYRGGGALLDASAEPIIYTGGLVAKSWRFTIGIASPSIDALIRAYNYRLAPVTVWRANYDPSTMTLIEYTRMLKGRLQAAPIEQPADGEMKCEVTCTTSAIDLTRNLGVKMNEDLQKQRSGDRFLKYIEVSGTFPARWAE